MLRPFGTNPVPASVLPSAKGLTRRQWLTGAGAAATLLATGCDRLRLRRFASAQKEVRVYIFEGYLPEAVLQRFTLRTGFDIHVETYWSNDELYRQLKSGSVQCDLILPTGYMAQHLRDTGFLVPLDKDKIPHLGLVNRALYNSLYDSDNRHTVPFLWGSMGIGYDSQRVSGLPKSWSALFTRQVGPSLPNAFNNSFSEVKVSMIDEARFVVGCTLIYLGLDPNTRDPTKITQAFDLLKQIRDRIDYFEDAQELLRSRTVGLAMAFTGDVTRAMRGFTAQPEAGGPAVMRAGNNDLRVSLPQEGSIVWRDVFAVPAMSKNYEGAHALINFLLDPRQAAEVTNFSCFANTVTDSHAYVDRFVFNGPSYFMHPSRQNYQLDYSAETNSILDPLWQELKSGGTAGVSLARQFWGSI
jgi:spermidine/putrescine-binding protein